MRDDDRERRRLAAKHIQARIDAHYERAMRDAEEAMSDDHTFTLIQDGMVVVELSGTDRAQCFREIMHYAMVYGQDGPCTVKGVTADDWEQYTDER